MISAKKANFISKNPKKEKIKQQLKMLDEDIKRVAANGKQGLIIYGRIFDEEMSSYLKKKGYEVIQNQGYIQIWWR